MSKATVVVGILIIATLTIVTSTIASAKPSSSTQDNLQSEEQQAKSLIERCSGLLTNATISTQDELSRCDSQILDLSNNACNFSSPNAWPLEVIKGPICNDPKLSNYLTVRNLWDKIG